jgi:hypothetical protein
MAQRQPRPGSRRSGSRTANARRRVNEEGDDNRQARRTQRATTSPAPILIGLFVLVGLVIGVIGWMNSDEVEEAAPEKKVVDAPTGPFQNVADETGPKSNSAPGASRAPRARIALEDLSSDPVWLAALAQVKPGYALRDEAEAAKKAKNQALFDQKAVAAREIFDSAIENTAIWEEELQTKFDDRDPILRKVMLERDKWFDIIRKYRMAGTVK